MTENRMLTKDGVANKGVSGDRNANYKPSVPANYNPPPPARVPSPPAKQGK